MADPSLVDASGHSPAYMWKPASMPNQMLRLMLRGWGGDERVMWALESSIPGQGLVVAPRGIFQLPDQGYAWTADGHSHLTKLPSFRKAGQAISSLTDDLAARRLLGPQGYVLIGFSQGAALSFAGVLLGLLRPRAIVALAAFLPEGGLGPLSNVPVFWGHGARDEKLPAAAARASAERLKAAGAAVTYCEADVGHLLGIECVRGLRTWWRGQFASET
jgi:phospholipase/carboxylesterase